MAAPKSDNVPIEELIKRDGGQDPPAADVDGYDEVVLDDGKGKVGWKSAETAKKKSGEPAKTPETKGAARVAQSKELKTQPTQPSVDVADVKDPKKKPVPISDREEKPSDRKIGADRAPPSLVTPKTSRTDQGMRKPGKLELKVEKKKKKVETDTGGTTTEIEQAKKNSEQEKKRKKKGCCLIG